MTKLHERLIKFGFDITRCWLSLYLSRNLLLKRNVLKVRKSQEKYYVYVKRFVALQGKRRNTYLTVHLFR